MCSGIAYGFIPRYSCPVLPNGNFVPACKSVTAGVQCCTKASNMGWRYTLFALGVVTLVAFLLRFVAFRFQESPKYLLYRGRDDKAVEVLHNIAKFNGCESFISLDDFNALSEEGGSVQSRESGRSIMRVGTAQVTTSFSTKLKLECSRYKLLFRNAATARLTVLVWITYIFDYWGFSVAGMTRIL